MVSVARHHARILTQRFLQDDRAHRDGHFTDSTGARIADPATVAKLKLRAEEAKKERFREMDAQQR